MTGSYLNFERSLSLQGRGWTGSTAGAELDAVAVTVMAVIDDLQSGGKATDLKKYLGSGLLGLCDSRDIGVREREKWILSFLANAMRQPTQETKQIWTR